MQRFLYGLFFPIALLIADTSLEQALPSSSKTKLINSSLSNDLTYSLAAKLLLWELEPNDFYYGYLYPVDHSTYTTLENIKPKWDPGFAIELGYIFAYDLWNVILSWEQFYTAPQTSFTSNGTNFIVPLTTFPSGSSHMTKTSSKLTTHINFLEIELGKSQMPGTRVLMHPYVGLRSQWVYLTYLNTYTDEQELVSTLKITIDNWGIGPDIGVRSSWTFFKELELYGRGSSGILVGNIRITHKLDSLTATPFFINRAYSYAIRPFSYAILGVGWGHLFQESWKLSLFLQWELISLRDIVGVIGSDAPSSRYVSIQGLNLGLGVDF